MKTLLIVTLLLLCAGRESIGAQSPKKPANPLAPVEDVAGLARVLLIGDSISMGYTIPVRKKLTGKANVHRPPTNCGPTTNGLAHIDAWLGDKKWDVIHFNWGLHDLKYVVGDGADMVDLKTEGAHHQLAPED